MFAGVEAIFWLIIILALIVVLMVAFVFVRRYFRDEPADLSSTTPFTLGDLRQLLKQGKLTQEEYDRLREQIIASAKKDTDVPPASETPGPAGPTPPLP